MGEVYRARDSRLDRDVAIKVLPELLAADRNALARFDREAKAVAALSHPNILAIHDFGTDERTAFAVMELLEGETLRGRLAPAALPARGRRDRCGDRGRSQRGARQGYYPPGSEAGEPLPNRRRPGQNPRLRPVRWNLPLRSRRRRNHTTRL